MSCWPAPPSWGQYRPYHMAQTHGGTLNVILNPEPPILMLGLNQQTPTQIVGGKIYESLLTYDFKLNPQASLAKSWNVSADGLTYTFELQEGVTWHDGKPFTADDVLFSLRNTCLRCMRAPATT